MEELERGPYGGFCNYGIFWVTGKDAMTGKKKLKKICAVSEASAIEKADRLGCVGPYTVELGQFDEPTDRQKLYGANIGIIFPDGCSKDDARVLLSRAIDYDGDDADPLPTLCMYAQDCGVCFSRFENETMLIGEIAAQLPLREKAIFYAHAVYSASSGSRLVDPRSSPKYTHYCRFADLVEADASLAKSLNERKGDDYKYPGHNTKAYRTVISCLR